MRQPQKKLFLNENSAKLLGVRFRLSNAKDGTWRLVTSLRVSHTIFVLHFLCLSPAIVFAFFPLLRACIRSTLRRFETKRHLISPAKFRSLISHEIAVALRSATTTASRVSASNEISYTSHWSFSAFCVFARARTLSSQWSLARLLCNRRTRGSWAEFLRFLRTSAKV